MQQATPQFTPLQMLEAGRQAEGQGKTDFALQFYLHLVEFYGQTPEAAEARTALARMVGAGRQQQQQVWAAAASARQRRYRSGYFLAALFSALGWMLILGATAAAAAGAGAYLFKLAFLQGLEVDTQRLLLRVPLAALGGGVLVVCGQVARALIDQANAMRELLAIGRGRSGLEP